MNDLPPVKKKNSLSLFALPAAILTYLIAIVVTPVPSIKLENAFCLPFTAFSNFLGCSPLGENLLSLAVYGSLQTFFAAVAGLGISLLSALILCGCVYLGGKPADAFLDMLADTWLSIPALFVALALGFFLGSNLTSLITAVAVSEWAYAQKWLLGRSRDIARRQFISSSVVMGAGRMHIFRKHLSGFLYRDIVTLFFISLPSTLLSVAALEFLGVSSGSAWPSLGYQIAAYKDYVFLFPQIALVPISALLLLIFAANSLRQMMAK